MTCFVRFTRTLAAPLALLLHHLSRHADAVYRRHRALLTDEPGYRAQATAGTAALLTLLKVPRPLAAFVVGVLRRPNPSGGTPQIKSVRDDQTPDTHRRRPR